MEEWAEIESDDMITVDSVRGGFDATEAEFCFELRIDSREFWFQLALAQVEQIAAGTLRVVEVRSPD